MASQEQVAILRQGAQAWNRWRADHGLHEPDLRGADFSDTYRGGGSLGVVLHGVNLSEADLSDARLPGAELQWADLSAAKLTRANLVHARFMGADLSRADLSNARLHQANINDARAWYAHFDGADLTHAYLWGTDFREATFRGADLTGANLMNTQLVRTDFQGATLVECKVFGIAAWKVELGGAIQKDLNVSAPDAPAVTVDNLELAQFIYLMLNNEKIRDVIDTLTSKVVLILGSFTPERKAVLDAMREELRAGGHDLVPVMFDFAEPTDRNFTETVTLLARMARFIIADLTDPRSIPQELQAIVPHVHVPVVPLLHVNAPREYAMFVDQLDFDWVLDIRRYVDIEDLIASFERSVIGPAEECRRMLEEKRLRRRGEQGVT